MSLAPDTSLSEDTRQALHDLVWAIPQNDLLTYAATGTPFIGGGFRKTSITVVRARILQVAEESEPIDDNLRQLLVRNDPCASCLALLSVEAVKDNLASLAALFGGPHLTLGLLLDPRLAALSKVDSGKGKVESPISNSEISNVHSQLSEALAPLLSVLGATGTAPAAFAPPAALKEARREIASLKGATERLERETANRTKAEEKAAKWQQKAEEAEKTIGPLRQRAEKAEADLARYRRETEKAADAIVETRIATEFSEWLGGRRAAMLREIWPAGAGEVGPAGAGEVGPAGAGEVGPLARARLGAASPREVGSPSDDDCSGGDRRRKPQAAIAADNLRQPRGPAAGLLARAAAAMARQAQTDLAAGTRSALEAKLAAYEGVLARCNALLADAIRPSEDLLAVEKDLAAEVRRLRRLLHPEADAAPAIAPEEALVRAVNAAADHELPDLKHMVNRLHDLQIITDAAQANLNERIRNRYATLYAKRGSPGLESGDSASPDYLLSCALEGQIPLIFMVDGHNTLFALQSRYSRPQDHRGPSSEARDWLVNDLVQVFSNARNCRVIIVFDGPERTEASPVGNVKVIYSGGGNADVEHRADDVLVAEARFLREANPNCRMLLATNDTGLASRAAALGVRNVAPTALLSYLR